MSLGMIGLVQPLACENHEKAMPRGRMQVPSPKRDTFSNHGLLYKSPHHKICLDAWYNTSNHTSPASTAHLCHLLPSSVSLVPSINTSKNLRSVRPRDRMNSRDFEVAFKHLVEYILPDGNITNTVSNESY